MTKKKDQVLEKQIQVPAPEVPSTKVEDTIPKGPRIMKKIELGITEEGNVQMNVVDEFRTYEFYGVIITAFIDVFGTNLINAMKNVMGNPDSARLQKLKEEMKKKIDGLT